MTVRGKVTIFILILAILAGVGYLYYEKKKKAERESGTYDKESYEKFEKKVSLALDPWSGYVILRSKKFSEFLKISQIGYKWETVEDLKERFKGLKDGKYNFVAATVDGYTLNGILSKEDQYPGVIIFCIDESKGGDAIVADKSIENIDRLNGCAISYSENYPSEHLLLTIKKDFGLIFEPKPVKSSEEAYKLLKNKEVKAAVVWEPETSTAVNEGFNKIIGTEKVRNVIVDVCIVSRDFLKNNEKEVIEFTKSYFAALKYYQGNKEEFVQLIAEDASPKLSIEVAKKVLDGIDFLNVQENRKFWLGDQSKEQLLSTIKTALDVQMKYKKKMVEDSELISKPNYIINSSIINNEDIEARVAITQEKEEEIKKLEKEKTTETTFSKLSSEQLEEKTVKVGTLSFDPIYFESGSSKLNLNAYPIVEKIAATLERYPSYRVRIDGYSSPVGSPEVNMRLSKSRAEAIVNYLVEKKHFDPNRFVIFAWGDTKPLEQKEGESREDWLNRNQRTDFTLLEEK